MNSYKIKVKADLGTLVVIHLWISFSFLFIYCSPGHNPLVVDPNYSPACGACHGDDLNGLALGPSLLAKDLKYGHSVDEMIKGISEGYPLTGMPGFQNTLSDEAIKSLAIWIGEKRANTSYSDFRIKTPLLIPDQPIKSELVDFRIEVISDNLGPWPYSLEPLPDGRFLVTEKTKGLMMISPKGEKSDLIEGLPKVYNDGVFETSGLVHGLGWILDVDTHPDYESNGWVYVSHGDRCDDCNAESRYIKGPVSMCRVIRGRIKEGKWTDQKIIWKADIETYTSGPETSTGGRMTFDETGHLYFSVGAKKYTATPPGNSEAYMGIQDISLPYGKIYRMNDDGSIPTDNPFYEDPIALKSIWTFGHRSPQGLEYNPVTRQLWGTEMGPRGGDEINYLQAGRNYGWPLYSKGLNYDGTKVEYGKYLGIELNLEDIEHPRVDMTPSPAVSSFVFYRGDIFPHWQNNLIVGSLKAATLYRFVIEGTEVVHEEILMTDLARIRDIEVGYDGYIYMLLEHRSGGRLVRMVPVNN